MEVTFTIEESKRFHRLRGDRTKGGFLVELMDVYECSDSADLSHIRRGILSRVSKGIGSSYLLQLTLLYSLLGQILKKLGVRL